MTYCSIMVMPTTLRGACSEAPCSTEMMMGIMAEDRAVALAKPRWMRIRNRDMTPMMATALMV